MRQFWMILTGRHAGRPMTDLDELRQAQPALAPLTRRLAIWQGREDYLGTAARLAIGSLPFGCWVRFVMISGRDRTLALAGQTFTVVIPLMIVCAAFAPDPDALPDYLISRFGLTGTSADAVKLLFSRPPGTTGTITALGLIILFYSLVSLTRAMQRLWEVSWEMEPTGVRGTIDALSGFGLFLAQVIVLALLGAIVRGAPFGDIVVFSLRLAVAFVLWLQLQYLLLSRRVTRHELVPGAVVGGIGQVVASLFSAIWMPHLISVNAQRYGAIGVTFALLSWLIVLSACLVASAVISAEYALRRRRLIEAEQAAPSGVTVDR